MRLMNIPRKRLFGSAQISLSRRIEFADLDFSRILERPLEDLLGRDIMDFVADPDRASAVESFKTLLSSGRSTMLVKHFCGGFNKPPVPVLTHACLLRNLEGGAVGVLLLEQILSEFGLKRVQPVVAF